MSSVHFREATDEDAEKIAGLILRLKRINEEFDSHLKVRDDAEKKAISYVKEGIRSEKELMLIAESAKKLVGVLHAEMRERPFYAPPMAGVIVDFYILPEFRRQNLGTRMLDDAAQRLKKMNAQIIIAEFPMHNRIATSFYEKHGFRGTMGLYARDIK